MKRYLQMALAGLVVAGMVAPAFAADIKVTGQVRQRYRYWQNISLVNEGSGSNSGNRNYLDIRSRFGADAKLSEGVRARIEIEADPTWGNQQPNDATGAGGSASPYVRQAWMDFQIPGLPEGWRTQMGRSFVSLGHGYVFGASLTGSDNIRIYGPLGPGTLQAWATSNASVDSSASLCCLGTTQGDSATYEAIDYKFEVAPKQTVEVYAMLGQDKGLGPIVTVNTPAFPGAEPTSNEWWLGGAYSGAIGPVALQLEGAYQGGNARHNAGTGPGHLNGGDVRRSAGFIAADATYKIIPEWDVGINLSWATGDDDTSDNTFNNFVGPLALYATSPTRVWTDSGFFNGNRTSRFIGNNSFNRRFNMWGRGSLDADISGKATAAPNGDLFSPGLRELKFHTKYAFSSEVTGWLNVIPTWADKNPQGISKYMGTEVDVKVSYKPYPNIVTNFYGGGFFVGGFFSDQAAQGTKDAYVFRWEAIVTF